MSQELLNKLTYVQFGQKLMQIEVIDFEQNTVIFRILKILKNEVFQLQKASEVEIITSRTCHTHQKIRNFLYFRAHVAKSLCDFKRIFYSEKFFPPPQVHVLEIRSLYVISNFFCQWHGLTLSEYRIVWFQLSIPDKVWGQYFGGNKILNMWLNPATTSLLSCFCKVNYSLVVLRSRLMQNS